MADFILEDDSSYRNGFEAKSSNNELSDRAVEAIINGDHLDKLFLIHEGEDDEAIRSLLISKSKDKLFSPKLNNRVIECNLSKEFDKLDKKIINEIRSSLQLD